MTDNIDMGWDWHDDYYYNYEGPRPWDLMWFPRPIYIDETELAIQVIMTDGGQAYWLPKSQVYIYSEAIKVPRWLCESKRIPHDV